MWKYSLDQLGWVNDETDEVSITDPEVEITLAERTITKAADADQAWAYMKLGHTYVPGVSVKIV